MEGIELLLASRSMKTRFVRGQAYKVSETGDHERIELDYPVAYIPCVSDTSETPFERR